MNHKMGKVLTEGFLLLPRLALHQWQTNNNIAKFSTDLQGGKILIGGTRKGKYVGGASLIPKYGVQVLTFGLVNDPDGDTTAIQIAASTKLAGRINPLRHGLYFQRLIGDVSARLQSHFNFVCHTKSTQAA